jgi:hypothetical protein
MELVHSAVDEIAFVRCLSLEIPTAESKPPRERETLL